MKITMKRRAAAWVVALAMLTGLTACGVSESTSELAGSASRLTRTLSENMKSRLL